MAAGLFASLFAASSSSSAPETATRKQSPSGSVYDSDETDDLEHQSPIMDHHDVEMPDAEASDAKSTVSLTDPAGLKEAQEVADVDMQLSSPPSSPPTAPITPQDASIPHAGLRSTKMEPTTSGPDKPLSSDSPLSTPTSEREHSLHRPGPSSAPAVQRTSRRRMMPARLSQVSSLLAGSSLEEELMMLETPASPSGSTSQQHSAGHFGKGAVPSAAGHATSSTSPAASAPSSYFSSSSIVVLSSDTRVLERAVFPNATPTIDDASAPGINVKTEPEEGSLVSSARAPSKPSKAPAASASSSLVSTLAIKRQQLIETPDFKQRDDTLYMPKTRGLRSEAAEDTSDAAYERRHRKPEAAEKRQRKAEVDRLTRDRQKLLSRIEQLKAAEPRMLQPIVVARDQVRAEASGSKDEAAQQETEVRPLSERVEDVRKELLDDAYETLKRYDLLLSISNNTKQASPGPSTLASKLESTSNAADDDTARSQSPRLKIRIKGGRATWETADSASPTSRQSPALNERSDVSRRVSARQPKQRVDSLPTPLTAAAVEAVEDSRRKRRTLSSGHAEEAGPAQRKASSARTDRNPPTRGKTGREVVSPDRPARRRASPEVGGTYKGKTTPKEQEDDSASPRTNGRPQRAAAAAAALASARQRRIAEHSFSDFDYDDEEGEVDSAIDEADSPSRPYHSVLGVRRASQSLRRSPLKTRDHRSPSTSSTTSSTTSMASSLGYMYPTLPDTGSLKVSQSLAEIHATDSGASRSLLSDDGARKKLKLALSSSTSAAVLDSDGKKALSEVMDMDVEEETSGRERGRSHGGALTESEAESILAAFLGTTPIGKKAAAASAQRTDTPTKASSSETTTKTTVAAPSPAATQSNNGTPSKRRSSRRDTTQSFGEKLPDLLTKTAPFDFSVMGYFQSIDRPGRTEQTLVEDSEDE